MWKTLNRRETIRLLAATPLLGLAACGKSAPDGCTDLTGLTEGEKTARAALQYTDRSMQNDKRCDLCSFYQPVADAAACGGCQLVKGPIHPKGYCTAFAVKT
ncbi:MAG: high-potential iron-sulfur protein [Polyangiales bacterium]